MSQVALAVHGENVEEQELAEPAIASAPETTVAEAEPERIADPVSQVALAVHEENVEEQELAEPAIVSAPETRSPRQSRRLPIRYRRCFSRFMRRT